MDLEQAQSHLEMSGFFELCFHYRELTNQKGAYQLNDRELGIMRDMDPTDQKMTSVMKLARKRFLEFTSSPHQHEVNLNRVRAEAQALVDVALDEGSEWISVECILFPNEIDSINFDN